MRRFTTAHLLYLEAVSSGWATQFGCGMKSYDVIVLGAGAAGLMCAAGAVKRGRRVLVLDHAKKPGEKILISGGGRCNFTNLHTTPANFLSRNPHFCKSALKRYTQYDFIDLVEKYGIAYHEKDLGQLFCDHSAKDIVAMLLTEAEGAEVRTRTAIRAVAKPDPAVRAFQVETEDGDFEAESLVVATGGPAIPQMGASGFAYEVAAQFGIGVVEPRAGLVPLTFDDQTLQDLEGLSGVAVDASAVLGRTRFDEALLFTHQGFSGPVILQISSYWREGDTLTIDMLPGGDAFALLKEAKQSVSKREIQTVLGEILPKRLAQRIAEITGLQGRMAELPDKDLRRAADRINAWQVTPSGSLGLKKAEVTLGGVDTDFLSSKTMEAKSVPGLYFIGEAVDVTGHLGGFNFQWAWASGHACGEVA